MVFVLIYHDSQNILWVYTEMQNVSNTMIFLNLWHKIIFNSSLEEENQVSSCTSTLAAKNVDLLKSLARLNAIFNKLDTYVAILAVQSKSILFTVAQ